MSQQAREHLSALMDGELSHEETMFLLRRVAHDEALAPCWSSFHAVRQVLRRQEFVIVGNDFANGVLARIDAEAAPLAVRSGAWLRWASGGAIAASVAVAALVFSGPRGGEPNAGDGTLASTKSSIPMPAPAQARPAEFRPPMISPTLDVQPASAATSGFAAQTTPIDPRLQSYLIRHYDATGSAGQSGLMPYVLLIVPSQQQAAEVKADAPSEQH